MNRPAKFITRTIKIRIPVNRSKRSNYGNRGNRNFRGNVKNSNRINVKQRLIPLRTYPKRASGVNYMIKNYYYKKQRKRGIPGLGMNSSHVYKYDNPVDTIFPLENTLKEVKERYKNAYVNKENFKSGDQVFNYSLGNNDIEQKFNDALELPNTNETNINYIMNQLLLPEVLRLPFMLVYDKIKLEYYKINDKTEELVKLLDEDKMDEFKEKIKEIEKDKQDKNFLEISKYMDGLFTNINLDVIDKISQIIEVKNIYTPQDKLKNIAKELQTKKTEEMIKNNNNNIQQTYYRTPSLYWRNMMPVLSNYDPREIILVATIITTQNLMFHELGVNNTISINELYIFMMSILDKKKFNDLRMLQVRKNKEILYDLIF